MTPKTKRLAVVTAKQNRIDLVSKLLRKNGLDAFIVSNPVNIFYLTAFKGISQTEREAYLVITPRKSTLITAKIYWQEAEKVRSSNLSVKIARERNEAFSLINNALFTSKKIGFEEKNLTYAEYIRFPLRSSQKKYSPFPDLVEKMRIVKSEDEIKKIEKAQKISQKAFLQVIKTIKVGQTEWEIAETLAKILKSLGGEGLAFESIIASGPNASIPHHITGGRKIKKGEVLLFDFGAKFQNYHADLSRTVFIGKAKDEHRNIYSHVDTAQKTAINKIQKGLKASDAFHLANNHFINHNLEKYFIHGLGHGVGLEIHEGPFLHKTSESILEESMVFSVEPGIYFPWGGVRIEDLVVIKKGKAKVLGKTQEKLIEV